MIIEWPKDTSLPLFLVAGEMYSISFSPIFVGTFILVPLVPIIKSGPTRPFLLSPRRAMLWNIWQNKIISAAFHWHSGKGLPQPFRESERPETFLTVTTTDWLLKKQPHPFSALKDLQAPPRPALLYYLFNFSFIFTDPASGLFVQTAQEDSSSMETAAQGFTPVLPSSQWQTSMSPITSTTIIIK